MAPAFEISVPSAATSSPADGKPYTAYQITIRLPLRSYNVSKRYSDFTTLHNTLSQQASRPPPASLPPKHFFSSTINNPALTEERRRGLETYLQRISSDADPRWRDTPAWRAFLNLPPASHTASARSTAAGSLHSAYTASSTEAGSDPVVWLDTHREAVAFLQTAKERLAARNSAHGPTAQQQEGAAAKKALVRAGTLLQTLEKGLKGSGDDWGQQRLGEGEIRRRRDLLGAARKERDRLEELQANIGRKEEYDEDVGREQEQARSKTGALFAANGSRQGGGRSAVGKGRVLGKETAQTRELDNNGVLQLQQQIMQDQDEGINALAAAVRRQRELAIQINEEIAIDTGLLRQADDDAGRLQGKMDIARKRVNKIS